MIGYETTRFGNKKKVIDKEYSVFKFCTVKRKFRFIGSVGL